MIQDSKVVILVDIDDVINNLCQCWIDWLNNKYGTNAKHEDVKEWDMCKVFPSLTKEEVFAPLHIVRFWETVTPREDAMIFLPLLYQEGYDIYLCTTTDYRNVKPKFENIVMLYFPYIKWDHVIIASDKSMIKGDFIIDDGVHNLERCNCIKILMDAPHNRIIDDDLNVNRAKNWEEAYEIIKKYAPTAEK